MYASCMFHFQCCPLYHVMQKWISAHALLYLQISLLFEVLAQRVQFYNILMFHKYYKKDFLLLHETWKVPPQVFQILIEWEYILRDTLKFRYGEYLKFA